MTQVASSFDAEESLRVQRDCELPWLQVRVRAFASNAGMDPVGQAAVAIAASEAVTNMQKYAGGGVLTLRARWLCPERWVEIEAADRGPGLGDPERAMLDGVSEGVLRTEAAWPLRPRGLGLGLGAIRRLMSELRIGPNPGGGTLLVARRYFI